ncbi:MAG: hypothetical protein CVU20_08440 [Betaproteobacteria bacterium HGW-Betaproteobacteria-14]|nr:MAG: hypothetical protein CVU20_08440 [Betaproteobacteria bacterium HGW-Betaproteobacteria-14]
MVEKIEFDHNLGRIPPRDDNTQRLLKLLVALAPVSGIIYLCAVVALSEEPVLRSTGVIAALCTALGAFVLLRLNRSGLAAQVLVWGFWISLQAQVFISNGLASRSLMALPIVIMMAGWLLSARSAIMLCVATVLFGLALALGEQANLLPLYDAPSPPLLVWLASSTYIVLASALAYYIFRGFRLRHEALRRSEEKFSVAFRSGPMAMSITRLSDGCCLDINDAFVGLLGWRREEVIGRNALEIGKWLAAEDQQAWARELSQSGRIANRESRCRTRSGVLRDVQMSSVLIELDGEPCALVLASDITERKRAGEKFAKVFHASPEAITISRLRDGLYLDVNEAFVEQIGWLREEVIGLTENDIGLWPSKADRQRWVAQLRQQGRVKSYEASLNARNGQRHTVLISAELFDLEGEQCVIGMLYDITEQEATRKEIRQLNTELEKRVQERTAELQSANKELESFAYSISHDLRAPLRGIDGFSYLLADEFGERLDAQGRGYLERVRRAAQQMGTLIDDILDLSRISLQEMRRMEVNLSQIAAEMIEEHTRTELGHRIEVIIAPECTAFGDPQLLRVMMQNLLENAWKYSSKEASPKIEFGRETLDGETVFFVRDNGVGFDMEYADRLFAPFQRLHKPEEFEGTGIGLATVARIVRRHGGRVWAESEPGKGATLRFTLGVPSENGQ